MTTPDNNSTPPRSLAEPGVHESALGLLRQFLPTGGKVVDVGAGEGAFAKMLVDNGYGVVALDFDDTSLKTLGIELRICDVNGPFASDAFAQNERFDAVVAIEVIEHLENPFAFVRESKKLLKDGGMLLITTPNVEAVNSRLLFLYRGRLFNFGDVETVPTGHVTPIFGWKAELMLREAGMEIVHWGYSDVSYHVATGLRGKIGSLVVRALERIVKGQQGGPTLILVAKPADKKAE